MVQKCSYLKVLKVFFIEPTTIHFIKGISKKIKLAPTSVRKIIYDLKKQNLIKVKKSKPFDGFIANRDNLDFLFFKRTYNLYSLKNLKNYLVENIYPSLFVVFGSYSLGEDIETSDIDVLIMSKNKKQVKLDEFEKKLKRRIHLIYIKELKDLDKKVLKKVYSGFLLYGNF